ncbi:hypothetical protein [Elizabethkingia miricola]|uniref:hypothetical protein n=2 Tax=Elizabethkingia TaxID=308865 RepID=UPI003891D299
MMDNNQNKNLGNFRIKGNWAEQARGLKRKFAELKDSDLQFEEGKEDELLRKLGQKLNKNREETIDIINKALVL